MSTAIVAIGLVLVVTLAIGAVATAVAVRRRRPADPELRCREALLNLGVDRDRRLWAAGSLGIPAASSEFGFGSGCFDGGCGGSGGCGGCGGCGG